MVDALNRRSYEVHIVSINMYRMDLKDKIIEDANLDQPYVKIKETLQQGTFQ
jgi:hypothetical protein